MLEREGRNWPLPSRTVLIGRDDPSASAPPDIDLHDIDVERSVSRRHAQLTRTTNGRYVVRDLGSGNGTVLDGHPILPGQDHLVSDGSTLAFADVTLTFRLTGHWPAALTPEWAISDAEGEQVSLTQTRLGRRRPITEPDQDEAPPRRWYRRLLARSTKNPGHQPG